MLAAAPRMGATEEGMIWYSWATRRRATLISTWPTPRGQMDGHAPQVVQRQMSSLSISLRP
jgi:hypothetical protein